MKKEEKLNNKENFTKKVEEEIIKLSDSLKRI